MKIQVLLIGVILFCCLYLSYLIGRKEGINKRNEIEIKANVKFQNAMFKNEISNRYLKIYGSPVNEDEQCKFDYIINNDTRFCK